MGNPQRGSKKHKQNKKGKASHIVNKDHGGRPKDHDQVHADMKVKKKILANLPRDEDKPGEGQFYCVSCAKHFADMVSLKAHQKSKVHKRRLKAIMTDPHTHQDADDMGKF
jgi:bud site selection protein 20